MLLYIYYMFSGVNVLNKSELEKVLERQKRLREEREREEEKEPETPFQRMLAERAKRLEQVNLKGIVDDIFGELHI